MVQLKDLDAVREKPFDKIRLTHAQIENIISRYQNGEDVDSISKFYSVSRMTIYRHLNLKSKK